MSSTPGPDLAVIQGGGGAEDVPRPAEAEQGLGAAKAQRQMIGAFRVPFGYEVWGDGTYEVVEPLDDEVERRREPGLDRTPSSKRKQTLKILTRRPLWLRQIGRTADTNEELVQLAFHDTNGRPHIEWATRAQLFERRQLIGLSALGIPVRTGTADRVEAYLDKALYENARERDFPSVLMGSKTGAYDLGDRGWGWLLGRSWIGPPGTVLEADPRSRSSEVRGYTVSGSEDAWFAMLAKVSGYGPIPRWLSFATFAAPLLRFLQHRTFIVHHWGDTGSGKTSLLKFAMSAWGDPSLLTATFNRTQMSFTEVFNYIDDLPVAFDELQSSNLDTFAPIIYALCLERGRGRAGRGGGLLKEIEVWHSIVRMTGEEPIIGNGRIDLGGQTNRVLQLNAAALEPSAAEQLHQWMDGKHYGWGGLRFIEALRDLLATSDGVARLQQRYSAVREEIGGQIDGLRSRISALAAIAVAQAVAMRTFFGVDKARAMHGAVSDAVHVGRLIAADEADNVTVADHALQVFRDHREANRKKWLDLAEGASREVLATMCYQELFGVLHAGPCADEVWLISSEATKLLRKERLPPTRVWIDLRRAGVLRTGEAGSTGRLAPIRQCGKFRNRVYVLRQARFDLSEET